MVSINLALENTAVNSEFHKRTGISLLPERIFTSNWNNQETY
jgi:hypothetical protein